MSNQRRKVFLIAASFLLITNVIGLISEILLNNVLISGTITVLLSIVIAFVLSGLLSKSLEDIELLIDRIVSNDLMADHKSSVQRGTNPTYDKLGSVVDEMKGNFKDQVDISVEITNISERLVSIVNHIKNSMEQITNNTDVTSNNSERQFEMLQGSKIEIEEIVNTLNSLRDNMADTVTFTNNTINATKDGINSTSKILVNMSKIRELVNKIGADVNQLRSHSDEVINLNKMVNDIAEQTNLLALNASIEAARAGEHGRGFAIVATEVSKLSQETNQVSNKIKEVISTLQVGLVDIASAVQEDIVNVEQGYTTIESTINEFNGIKLSLEESSSRLNDMNVSIIKVNEEGRKVAKEIVEVTRFSEEITSQMQEAASQIMFQNSETTNLLNLTETLNTNADKLVQFVASKVMTGKMLSNANEIERELRGKSFTNGTLNQLTKKYDVDAIYITDTNGIVRYCNEENTIGLNLFEIDPSYKPLREGKVEYITTPIKHRVEDGKLFKFLSILNDKGEVYQVGLALETLQRI